MKPMNLLRNLCVVMVLAGAPAALAAAKAPSQLIPEQATVCLEILKPAPLVEALLSPAFESRLKGLPGYENLVSTPQVRDLRNAAAMLQASLHTNWQAIARSVLRGKAALAFGGGNRHLLVLTGDDPALLQKLHEIALQVARSEAEKRGESEQVRSMDYEGLTGWTFNGKEAHTLAGNQLLAASDAAVLKAAVDLRNNPGASLAERADYKSAREAVGPEAVAILFLDLQKLRTTPQFKAMLEGPQANPLACLVLAEFPEILKTARWLALGAYIEQSELVLRAFSDATPPAGAAAFAQVKPGARGLAPNLEVPRLIAALNLHRDLAGFYAAKDTLFPERTSGLIFFENMMGIFFSGRNLTDEVLAETQPQVQLVVARQEYDRTIGVPEPQIPAFALVLELRNPDKFGEVLEEAWQKALGLVNFTRGQKAEPGLILDRAEHNGSRITLAKFSSADIQDRAQLDTRFNFRPSLALAGNYAILSSTDQLARDLLDAAKKVSATNSAAPATTTSLARLSGAHLAGILRDNRMSLVRGEMTKKGKSQQEAEAGMDIFIALVGWINQANLATGATGRGQMAELRLNFSKP